MLGNFIKQNKLFVCLISLLIFAIVFVLLYRKINTHNNKVTTTNEAFTVLDETQSFNSDVLLSSLANVKFNNAYIGNYYTSETGSKLSDVFTDIYDKLNALDLSKIKTKLDDSKNLINEINDNSTQVIQYNTGLTQKLGDMQEKVAILQNLSNAAIESMPIGSIVMWNSDRLPSGNMWVLCDGANYSVSDNGKVYNIATPDLRGKFILGSGTDSKSKSNYEFGGQGGEEKHILTEDEMPPHQHKSPFVYGAGAEGAMGPFAYVNTGAAVGDRTLRTLSIVGTALGSALLLAGTGGIGAAALVGTGGFGINQTSGGPSNPNGISAYTSVEGGDSTTAVENNQYSTKVGQTKINTKAKAHNVLAPYYVLKYIIKIANKSSQVVRTRK